MASNGCDLCGAKPDPRERFEFRVWGEKSWRRFWLCLPCYRSLTEDVAQVRYERHNEHLAKYFGVELGEKR